MSEQLQILIDEDAGKAVDVRLNEGSETVWLTQRQMGELFETTPENVLMHLKNIFNDEELTEEATAKDFLVVRQEGRREVRRKIQHYNLDAIISIGYRVNSRGAVRFRSGLHASCDNISPRAGRCVSSISRPMRLSR